MIKIGDFSKLSLLSISVLRHYDQVDLLKPAFIDPDTGYRYYTPQQLRVCHQIKALRSLGMGLSAIKEIILSDNDKKITKTKLSTQLRILMDEKYTIDKQIGLLEAMLKQGGNENSKFQYSVNVKELPERFVVSLRQIIPDFQSEGNSWNLMMNELSTQKIVFANPIYASAIFHDIEYKEENVDVEIQMTVENQIGNTEHVCFKKVKSLTVASVVMEGSYDNMGQVTSSIAEWISDSQYRLSGPMFNIYLVGPNEESNPEKWVTEVCFPIVAIPSIAESFV